MEAEDTWERIIRRKITVPSFNAVLFRLVEQASDLTPTH
jgi:hypothetical protein